MNGPKSKLFTIILIAGAAMMILAFLMPWWSIKWIEPAEPEKPGRTVNQSREERESDQKAYFKKVKKRARHEKKRQDIWDDNERWYEDMKVDRKLSDEMEEQKDAVEDEGSSYSATVRLWGPQTAVGITALIFGIFILPVGIVPMVVAPFREWSWIGFFVAAVLGLIGLIVGMVFYFGSPGQNYDDYLEQGVGIQPGPWLVMFGSLAVLTAAVWNGVFGLLAFIEGVKGDKKAKRDKKAKGGSGRRQIVDYDLDMEEF